MVLLLFILSSLYFLVYFHRTSTAVSADLIVLEFGVSAVALGILSSMYFYPYAFLQIPVGVLSDTVGARKVIIFFSTIAAIGCAFFASAVSYEMMVFGRLLIGIGASGVYVPSLKILSKVYPGKYATSLGVLFAIGNLGAMFSSYPFALSVSTLGWRETFYIIFIFNIILIILFFYYYFEKGESGESLQFEDLRILIKNRNIWLLNSMTFLRYGALMSYQGLWGGPYIIEVYNASRDFAGLILLFVGLGSLFGAPILGFLSDKIGSRKKILVVGGVGFSVSWLFLAFRTYFMSTSELIFSSFIMGFFGGAGPAAYALTKESFPSKITGFASSFLNIFPFIGAASFQILLSYMIEIGYSYQDIFLFCFISSIFSTLFNFLLKEQR